MIDRFSEKVVGVVRSELEEDIGTFKEGVNEEVADVQRRSQVIYESVRPDLSLLCLLCLLFWLFWLFFFVFFVFLFLISYFVGFVFVDCYVLLSIERS